MKISQAIYIDDGAVIPGVLVKRFLRKPVFYTDDPSCGWDSQVITKAEKSKVVIYNYMGSMPLINKIDRNAGYRLIKELGKEVDTVYDKKVLKSAIVDGLVFLGGAALVAVGIYVLTRFM